MNQVTIPTTGTEMTLYYTGYKAWSGRSYYGRSSGVRAVEGKSIQCKVGRITEKAVEFIWFNPVYKRDYYCWIPKSCIEDNSGKPTVKRGFCYRNNGLQWKQVKIDAKTAIENAIKKYQEDNLPTALAALQG